LGCRLEPGAGLHDSAAIQAFLSAEQMRRAFGCDGFHEIALATISGAVRTDRRVLSPYAACAMAGKRALIAKT
jgi:hypothetical protein